MKKTILLLAAMVAMSVLPAKAWDNMYLIGTATTAGYTLENAVQMTGSGDQFVWTGNLSSGEFKFLTDKGWCNMYGPAHNEYSTVSENTSYNQLVIGATYDLQFFSPTEGNSANPANPEYGDYKFGVEVAGMYTLIVNTTTMTLKVKKYPAAVYPVGNGCEVGWNPSGVIEFPETGEDTGIYEGLLELTMKDGNAELKFLCQKGFAAHFGPQETGDGQRDIAGNGEVTNFTFVENGDHKWWVLEGAHGKKKITVNAAEGKLVVADAPATSVENTTLQNDNIVYDIMGRALGTSVENLPLGIYVRNGKKFVVAQ